MILLLAMAVALLAIVMASTSLARKPLPADSPISERADRRWRKGLLIAAIAVAVLGNVPLIGLPGFGFLELAYPLVRLLPGSWPLGRFESGGSWPSAMMITAAWPACFLPAYWLARQARSGPQLLGTTLAAVLLAGLTGVVLALLFVALYFVW